MKVLPNLKLAFHHWPFGATDAANTVGCGVLFTHTPTGVCETLGIHELQVRLGCPPTAPQRFQNSKLDFGMLSFLHQTDH